MPNPITLPATGQTINDRTEVSGLITSELAAWIDLGYFPGGGGSGNAVTLQGKAISVTAPTANQVLEWSGTAWVPTTLPSSQPLNSVLTALETVMSATATATAQRTALGLGSAALSNTSAFDAAGAAAAAQAAAIAASDPSGSAAAAQAAAIAASQPLNSVLTALESVMSATATAAAQRTALGLGGAALLAVGTTAGTVAAGDDSRFRNIDSTTVTDADHTIVPGDAGTAIRMSSASGHLLNIDTIANQATAVGDVVELRQIGTGQVTITPLAGVTFHSDGGLTKTKGQYAVVRLVMDSSDVWFASGDLA